VNTHPVPSQGPPPAYYEANAIMAGEQRTQAFRQGLARERQIRRYRSGQSRRPAQQPVRRN
jgi:hypothetical protein